MKSKLITYLHILHHMVLSDECRSKSVGTQWGFSDISDTVENDIELDWSSLTTPFLFQGWSEIKGFFHVIINHFCIRGLNRKNIEVNLSIHRESEGRNKIRC